MRLFAWSVPVLPIVAVIGFASRRRQRPFRLLFASVAVTVAVYFASSYGQGHGWGTRYVLPAWGVVPILATAALMVTSPVSQVSLRHFVVVLSLACIALHIPLKALQVERVIGNALSQAPTLTPGAKQVRFILPIGGEYTADLVQNDPFLGLPSMTFLSQGGEPDARFMAEHFIDAKLERAEGLGSIWSYRRRSDHFDTAPRH